MPPNMAMEEVHVVKNAPPIQSLQARMIHELQPVMIAERTKLIRIHKRPSQGPQNINLVHINSLQHLRQESLIVDGSF
jgi:hypothetical protein